MLGKISKWPITSRQGLMSCRLVNVVLCALMSIIASYGFGNKILFESAAITLISVLIISSLRNVKTRVLCLPLLSIFVGSMFRNSILQSSSLVAIAIIVSGQRKLGASLLLSHLLPYVGFGVQSNFATYIMSPLFSFFAFWMSIAFMICAGHFAKNCVIIVCAIYGFLLIVNSFISFPIDKCSAVAEPGYGLGNSVEKILQADMPTLGQLYYANQANTVVTNSGTVYLDHDSFTIYDGGEFAQKSPWSQNMLISAEPYRVNAAEDGCLVMNIGSRIRNARVRPLWGLGNNCGFSMLCGYDGKRLIFGDSDLAGDMLAPYQVHLWRHIGGKDIPYRIWMFAVGIVLIIFFVFIIQSPCLATGILCVISLLFHMVMATPTYDGGVRYVGYDVLYPHTSQAYGLVRALQKSGISKMFTSRKAGILAVGEGHFSKLESEDVVILEPNAGVYIQGQLYIAGETPLGPVGNIVDARDIFDSKGRKIGSGAVVVDGVMVVASGSPASQNWRQLLCK